MQGLGLAVGHELALPCLEEAACCRERLQPEEELEAEEEEDVRKFREQEAAPVETNAARGRPQHGGCADARCISLCVLYARSG